MWQRGRCHRDCFASLAMTAQLTVIARSGATKQSRAQPVGAVSARAAVFAVVCSKNAASGLASASESSTFAKIGRTEQNRTEIRCRHTNYVYIDRDKIWGNLALTKLRQFSGFPGRTTVIPPIGRFPDRRALSSCPRPASTLPAFGIVAARTLVTAFDPNQCRLAAFRTLRHAGG
jgi:hypothetical protein